MDNELKIKGRPRLQIKSESVVQAYASYQNQYHENTEKKRVLRLKLISSSLMRVC